MLRHHLARPSMRPSWLSRFVRCAVCDAAAGDPVCRECERDFLPPGKSRCVQCALPLPNGVEIALCGRCLHEPPHFDAATALGDYASPLDGMIAALKFSARLELADTFGRLLARRVKPAADAWVVPVPLDAARAAQRGYNQSLLIARAFCRATGATLAAQSLARVRPTAPQQSLALAERRRNVRGAFAAAGDLGGRSILIVDDVMTSGCTLDEAARALKAGGARRVEALVAARTP
jgi:ComF family protein